MFSQQSADTELDNSPVTPLPSNVFARRSTSIFSRRGGTESVDFSQTAAMRGLSFVTGNRQPAQRTRSHIIKPKKSKGTVLNAVPPTSSLAQLSPSVYAAPIKPSSPLDFACTTASSEHTSLKETQSMIIADQRQAKHTPSRSSVERIGVWVDGIVHWEGMQAAQSSQDLAHDSQRHMRAASDESGYRLRPGLSIIIPERKLLTREQSITALKRPATRDGSMRPVQRDTLPTDLQREFAVRMEAYNKKTEPSRIVSRDVSPIGTSVQGSSKGTTFFSPVDTSRAGSSASQRQDPSRSSSTASSAPAKDDASTYSKSSSHTSVDAHLLKRLQSSRHKFSASAAFSIVNPTVESALEEFTPTTKRYMDKPLPLPPMPRSQQLRTLPPLPSSSPPLPTVQEGNTPLSPKRPQTSRGLLSHRQGTSSKAQTFQQNVPSTLRHTQSMSRFDVFDSEFMKTSPYAPAEEAREENEEKQQFIVDSPTLSQAEALLHEHLGRISSAPEMPPLPDTGLGICGVTLPASSSVLDEVEPADSITQPPSRAPTIPRRNPSRECPMERFDQPLDITTRRSSDPTSMQLATPCDDAPPADWWVKNRLSRSVSSASLPKLHGYAEFIARDDKELVCQTSIDDGLIVVEGPRTMHKRQKSKPSASQEAAEGVLVKILASLTSLNDLMNTMRINRGMYRVYCENKQRLVKTVAHNESLPAVELRQWLGSRQALSDTAKELDEEEDDIVQEQSVESYVQAWQHDLEVIEKLKALIVTECQSIIRKETVAAMADPTHPEAQRINDAFWRIWCFCAIFGCHKGRDEDLTGQLDWLKGGRLANNLDCAATVSSSSFDFDVGSILLNAPEYFGEGNGAGLTAEQLYDVTEIWTCMATLLQGYLGRVDHARKHGVYDNCEVADDDVEKAEHMIEEWIAFVLTLGPGVVLELAEYASDRSSAGFALAQQNGWTKWKPPVHTASRVTFLKEPVARLYEERVTASHTKATNATEQAKKLETRRRVAAHAQEIRMRRQDSAFKRVPLVDMSMERPMSIMSTLSANPVLTPRFPPKDMSLPPLPTLKPTSIHPALRPETAISPNTAMSIQQALLSPPLRASPSPPTLSPRMIPAIAMTQHQARYPQREALRAFGGVGIGTVELAIERIVAMGFTDVEAKHALRTTDGGDGLRVDRAVEYLMRSRSPQKLA